jgi:hypothetical protein
MKTRFARPVRRAFAAFVALGVAAPLALQASPAAAAALPTLHAANGLTNFGGSAIVDPAGRFWNGDHINGFCRISAAAPGVQEPGTCLGGLQGRSSLPLGAGQASIDPAHPEFVYIPDNNRLGCTVVRAKWNEATSLYDFDHAIILSGCSRSTNIRPLATTVGPDGAVYVLSHRTGAIMRIPDPMTAVDASNVTIVGQAQSFLGGTGIAFGVDRAGAPTIYMIEIDANEVPFLTSLHPTGPNAVSVISTLTTGPVRGIDFDTTRGLLYIGTARATTDNDPADQVDAFDMNLTDGDQSQNGVVTGMSTIVGVSVRPDGALFVLDDPNFPSALQGNGRMFLAGPASAVITSGPHGIVKNASPVFGIAADPDATGTQCAIVSTGAAVQTWLNCNATFQPVAPLADGPWTMHVRATSPRGTGLPATRAFVVDTTPPPPPPAPPAPPAPPVQPAAAAAATGYRMLAADGGIFSFGDAAFLGSTGGIALNQPIVGMARTKSGNGYWLVARDGGIFSFGDAAFLGSTGGIALNQPIVGMARTKSGNGYWLVARDGGIFSFGDAAFFGSTGGIALNQPIIGMVATVSGNGYWLYARDGGLFSFGDARFFGSTGGTPLNQPIVGMARTNSGNGYWLVARDGGVFAFGDAGFLGSTGGITLNQPIAGMLATPSGNGYWLVARDGGVFAFGDAPFLGSTGSIALNQPIIAMA